jgi:hypothetical protein
MLDLELNRRNRTSGVPRGGRRKGLQNKTSQNRMRLLVTKTQSRLSANEEPGVHSATRLCLTRAADAPASPAES